MRLYRQPIEWYVNRMIEKDCFSVAGYSDAEWYCIMKIRLGTSTGLGQMISKEHGQLLLDVLHRRKDDASFLFAIPRCLWALPQFVVWNRFNRFLKRNHLYSTEAYERDMVTDNLARDAGLYPFIRQLQKMDTVVIGNTHLRGLDFLGCNHFVEISSPNLHLQPDGIAVAVSEALDYGKPAVYLISAGVSAAIIADQLHDKIPDSWFIDCGSIWDAFVGVGGQREWRRRLFENPEKLAQWKHDNIFGKE